MSGAASIECYLLVKFRNFVIPAALKLTWKSELFHICWSSLSLSANALYFFYKLIWFRNNWSRNALLNYFSQTCIILERFYNAVFGLFHFSVKYLVLTSLAHVHATLSESFMYVSLLPTILICSMVFIFSFFGTYVIFMSLKFQSFLQIVETIDSFLFLLLQTSWIRCCIDNL